MSELLTGLLLAYLISKALRSPWTTILGFAFLVGLVVLAVVSSPAFA